MSEEGIDEGRRSFLRSAVGTVAAGFGASLIGVRAAEAAKLKGKPQRKREAPTLKKPDGLSDQEVALGLTVKAYVDMLGSAFAKLSAVPADKIP